MLNKSTAITSCFTLGGCLVTGWRPGRNGPARVSTGSSSLEDPKSRRTASISVSESRIRRCVVRNLAVGRLRRLPRNRCLASREAESRTQSGSSSPESSINGGGSIEVFGGRHRSLPSMAADPRLQSGSSKLVSGVFHLWRRISRSHQRLRPASIMVFHPEGDDLPSDGGMRWV